MKRLIWLSILIILSSIPIKLPCTSVSAAPTDLLKNEKQLPSYDKVQDSKRLKRAKRAIDLSVSRLRRLIKRYKSDSKASSRRKDNLAKSITKYSKSLSDLIINSLQRLNVLERIELLDYLDAKLTAASDSSVTKQSNLRQTLLTGKSESPPNPSLAARANTPPTDDFVFEEKVCGFYGPYYAKIWCDALTSHPNCWCKFQFAGYGYAKCTCEPGPKVTPPPPKPEQICEIEPEDYGCDFGGAGVSGRDPGCRVVCPIGKKPRCTRNKCEEERWTSSKCECVFEGFEDIVATREYAQMYLIGPSLEEALGLLNASLTNWERRGTSIDGVMELPEGWEEGTKNEPFTMKVANDGTTTFQVYWFGDRRRVAFNINQDAPVRYVPEQRFPVTFTQSWTSRDGTLIKEITISILDNKAETIVADFIYKTSSERVESHNIFIKDGKIDKATYSYTREGNTTEVRYSWHRLNIIVPSNLNKL